MHSGEGVIVMAKRGLAALSEEARKQIARKGGQASRSGGRNKKGQNQKDNGISSIIDELNPLK